jgi:hypothetical protein
LVILKPFKVCYKVKVEVRVAKKFELDSNKIWTITLKVKNLNENLNKIRSKNVECLKLEQKFVEKLLNLLIKWRVVMGSTNCLEIWGGGGARDKSYSKYCSQQSKIQINIFLF